MFHARIGGQALEIALPHDEQGRDEHGEQPEGREQGRGEIAQPGGQADLIGAENAEEGAVEQRPGKQGRDKRRRFGMGVGQPGVHGGHAHFGAVADEQEHKGRLEPAGVHAAGRFLQGSHAHVHRAVAAGLHGDVQEQVAHQG